MIAGSPFWPLPGPFSPHPALAVHTWFLMPLRPPRLYLNWFWTRKEGRGPHWSPGTSKSCTGGVCGSPRPAPHSEALRAGHAVELGMDRVPVPGPGRPSGGWPPSGRVQGEKLRAGGPPVTGILCVQVAEVTSPMADSIAVELVRLRSLEAKGVTVRTLSAQGESTDSAPAAIPPDLLVPPTPHLRTPTPKPLASVGAPDTKDEHLGPHVAMDGAWEQSGAPAPAHGHMLEPPSLPGSGLGRRSPSPSRILPQPQGTPVSTSVAKAMAREAAQRVAESSRVRLGFSSLVCGGGCSRHWGCLGGRDAAWPPCARGLLSRPDPDGIKMYSQYVKMGPCTQRNCLSTSLAELRQQAVSGPVPRLCLC